MNLQGKEQMLKYINNAKYGLGFLALAVVIYVLFGSPAGGLASEVEADDKRFGISTNPASGFLQAPNMYPGQKVSADLTVKNVGEAGFAYNITAREDSGDRLLFDKLRLF
jgi:hypothetical protein